MTDGTPNTETWQLLPELTAEEFAALKADIARSGVRVPVVIDAESGAILDGHHRIKALEELRREGRKVPEYPRQVVRFQDDEERATFVLATNLFRRNLTKAQRQELVASLRAKGWSLRRIGEALGVGPATVHRDLGTDPDGTMPERIIGKDGRSQPARRLASLFVRGRREEGRARAALAALPEGAQPSSLLRAEEVAREAAYRRRREAADVAARLSGPSYELRVGDLREAWDDIPDGSIDAIVTDPPYDGDGVPLYVDLARLAARVLRPGRLAAIYCGHLHLDEEMRLLEEGGLTYTWHGVNLLPGQHTRVRVRMMNGHHRSVLLFSAGPYVPRKWIHDVVVADDGPGGPEARPLHPWQQAVGPVVHWVHMTSEPGELIFDPFLGSGTTAVAAIGAGRRFLGGDIEAGNVATTRERIQSEIATVST